MSAPDYFPLVAGRVLEYQGAYNTGEEAGTYRKLEILKVTTKGKRTTAQCRWTYEGRGKKTTWKTTLTKDKDWMLRGEAFLPIPGRKLFPLPVEAGKTWRVDRWQYQVGGTDGEVQIGEDAGVPIVLKNCLEVGWHFDEGAGEQIYAPGIGLVKATSTDEQYPFGFILTTVSGPKK